LQIRTGQVLARARKIQTKPHESSSSCAGFTTGATGVELTFRTIVSTTFVSFEIVRDADAFERGAVDTAA
jgi:hypothetical protein